MCPLDDLSDGEQNISPENPISEANIEEQEGYPTPGQYDDEGIYRPPRPEPGTRLHRALRQLDTEYNPTVRETDAPDDEDDESEDNLGEVAGVALVMIMGGGRDPLTFDEAWNHPDPEKRKKWREAIAKEFRDMKRCRVWKLFKKHKIPPNRRLIGCKWVFKEKNNGVFRARLVALGYNQIPGVDYTENYAPATNRAKHAACLLLADVWSRLTYRPT